MTLIVHLNAQIKNTGYNGGIMKFSDRVVILDKEELQEDVFTITFNRTPEMGIIKPGQFFNLSCDNTLLRRPISVYDVKNNAITLAIKRIGKGTEFLSKLRIGDTVNLMGPLGNGFDLIDGGKALIVGGGIGVAPLKPLLESIGEKGTSVDAILGFRNHPFLFKTFQENAHHCTIVSETESDYLRGYVTDPLNHYLEGADYDMVYVCGPLPMLKAVAHICNERKVKAQLLMEEKMACGVGACLVCTCKIKEGDFDFKHKRMCVEGPMFYASEVIFDV